MSGDTKRTAIAHRAEDGREHGLDEHLREVGELAAQFASVFGAGPVARTAGLWHDLGKYAARFQSYIRGEGATEAHTQDVRGSVDHSSAGAVLAAQSGTNTGRTIASVIAAHHAGLSNSAELTDRLVRKTECLDLVRAAKPPAELLALGVDPFEGFGSWAAMPQRTPADRAALKRRFEFFTRMLFSALCDADFLDTESFFDPGRSALRHRGGSVEALADALRTYLDTVEERARALPETEVLRIRREVRAACFDHAKLAPGFFSLTVPTGGGKTLASMHFALEHARAHGLRRVVCLVPYTAIIEQSAAVYRQVFNSFGDDALVEHHSALDPQRETARNRVSSENWDAPVIVSTTVQFFESMFANRPSHCRKLHNLARSVVVLDEAQSLPPALLPTILEGLQTLVEDYGASVVFSTATQPAFRKRPQFACGVEPVREIAPNPAESFQRLRRVAVQWPVSTETPSSWKSLASELAREGDVLAIVHRRDDARALCTELDALLGDTSTVHLSALMYPEHRSRVLASLLERKRRGEPVRLVATQLVEAGVDVDFAVVYRALAGFDALAQAAGRCNREGRLQGRLGELRVFVAPTDPPSELLKTSLSIAQGLLREKPSLDLFAPATQESFFKRLYKNLEVASEKNELQRYRAQHDFETVANRFRMIDDDWSAPVVVADGAAVAVLKQIEQFGPSRARLRRLQRYTVAVSKRDRAAMERAGSVRVVNDTIYALENPWEGSYDARFGLQLDSLRDGVADPGGLVI